MPDIGYGSPVRLGSGQNEGQNLFGFSWSSDSSLLASLAGTATEAVANDPLGWINYAAQTSPGAAPGIEGQPNFNWSWKIGPPPPGYSGTVDPLGKTPPQRGSNDAIGAGIGGSLLNGVQGTINQAIIKLAFVFVALIILYVGLKKLANE